MTVRAFRSSQSKVYPVVLIAVAFLLGGAMTAQADHGGGSIVVGDDGGADFTSIQAAVDHADPGDTIRVLPGTYGETVTIDRDGLTLCSSSDGSACDGAAGDTIIHTLGEFSPAVEVAADQVRVEGFFVNVAGPGTGIDASGASQPKLVDNEVEVGIPDGEFGDLAALNPQHRDYWLDPFVEDTFTSGTLDDIIQERQHDEGFLAAQPIPDGPDHVALFYEEDAPPEAHEMADQAQDPAIRVYEDQGPPEPLIRDGTREESSGVPAEGNRLAAPEGIGPGALVTDGSCTANWVWQTTDGGQPRYFLGTAGHCVVGSGVETDTFSMNVCVEGCVNGRLATPGEVWVDLDPVYAVNRGIGTDVAVAEIPVGHYDDIRQEFSHWEGPDGEARPGALDRAVQEGWGTGSGDTFPTHPRAGIFASQFNWNNGKVYFLGHTSFGDSGSAVGSGVLNDQTPEEHILQGDKAVGVVTHLCGGIGGGVPFNSCGTSTPRANQLVRDFTGGALDLRVVHAGDTIQLPDVLAPENLAVDDPGLGDTLRLSWDEPSSGPAATSFEVHRSQGSTSFADKALVATLSDTSFEDTGLVEDQTYCYQLVSVGQNGESGPTSEVCETPTLVDRFPVPAPSFVHAVDRGEGDRLAVLWDEPDLPKPGVQTLDVYVVNRTDPGGSTATVATVDAAERRVFLDTDVDEGSSYTYTVHAVVEQDDGDGGTVTVHGDEASAANAPSVAAPAWHQSQGTADGSGFAAAEGDIQVPLVADTEAVGGPVQASPVAADLDGDGAREVVVVKEMEDGDSTDRIEVVAYDWTAAGFEELWRHQMAQRSVAGVPANAGFGTLAVGDLDGDGSREVAVYTNHVVDGAAVTGNNGAITVLDGADGSRLDADASIVIGVQAAPRLADVTGDGTDEIVLVAFVGGTQSNAELHVYEYSASDGIQGPIIDPKVGNDNVLPAPLVLEEAGEHGDGPALAAGNPSGKITFCEPTQDPGGSWSANCKTAATLAGGVTGLSSGFFGATEEPSILAHTDASTVALVDPDIGVLGSATTDDPLDSPPAAADLRRSGLVDTAGAVSDGAGDVYFHGFSAGGTLDELAVLARPGQLPTDSTAVPGGTVAADIDGDGSIESLLADEEGSIVAVSPDLQGAGPELLWQASVDGDVQAPLALADVTGDGALEVVAVTSDGTLAVVDAAAPGPVERVGIELSGTTDAVVSSTTVTARGGPGSTFGILARTSATSASISSTEVSARETRPGEQVTGTGIHLSADADGSEVVDSEIRWIGESSGQVRAIRAAGDDVTIRDNLVHVGNDLTDFAFAVDVSGTSGADVVGNTIEAALEPTDQQAIETNSGVAAWGGADDLEVRGNTIEGWFSHGIVVNGGDAPTIAGNTLQSNQRGFTLCDTADPHLEGNAFARNLQAGWFCSSVEDGDDDGFNASLRDNSFGADADPQPLVLDSRIRGATIDARLNDWGVVGEEAVRARINDAGTDNEILVKPYLDGAGNAHPPLPEVWCFKGSADLETKGTTLGLQEGVDADLATGDGFHTVDDSVTCMDADGDGRVHRTIILGEDIEAYDGATVDTEVLIASSNRDGIAGGARIVSQPDQPALEFVAGSEGDGSNPEVLDVTVETASPGIVVQADDVTVEDVLVAGQAGPGVAAESVSGFELSESVIDLQNGATAATGVQLTGTADSVVADNVIHGTAWPGSLGIDAEATDGTAATGNVILGSYSGIRLADSTGGTVEANVVLAPRNAVTTDSLGISLHRGDAHALADNLVQGGGTGLLLGGTDDVTATGDQFPDTATSVRLRALGGTPSDQPTGFEIHRANLFGEEAGLVLGGDTSGLAVDAECNDWGAYHAATIASERIDDRGAANAVDFQPFIEPSGSGAGGCLVPPTADFDPRDTTVPVGSTVEFTDGSEAGSKPIARWDWSFGDGTNDTIVGPNGSTSHTYEATGTFPVVLTVEDGDGMTSRAVGTVEVVDPAPAFRFESDKTVTEGETLRFLVEASDPQGDPVTLSASNLPTGATFSDLGGGDGRFAWTPGFDQAGSYLVDFTASDGTSGSTIRVAIAVEDAPAHVDTEILPPLAQDLTPHQLNPGQTVRFEGLVEASQTTIDSVVFHPDGSDSPSLQADLDPDDLRGDVWRTDTFAYETTGVKTLVMEVTDAGGNATVVTKTVDVTSNAAPVALTAQQVVTVDGVEPRVRLDGSPSLDPDGRPITWLWSLPGDELRSSPGPSWSVPPVTWTPDAAGIHTAELTVQDHAFERSTTTVEVRVDDAVGVDAGPAPGSSRLGPKEQATVVADVVDEGGDPRSGATVWFNVTHVATGETTSSTEATTDATGHLEVTLPYDVPATSGTGVNLAGEHRVTVETQAPNLLDLEEDPGSWETDATAFTYEVALTG